MTTTHNQTIPFFSFTAGFFLALSPAAVKHEMARPAFGRRQHAPENAFDPGVAAAIQAQYVSKGRNLQGRCLAAGFIDFQSSRCRWWLPNGMERGCPTRSSQDCQRTREIPRVLGLSNVLRLRQPRSEPNALALRLPAQRHH